MLCIGDIYYFYIIAQYFDRCYPLLLLVRNKLYRIAMVVQKSPNSTFNSVVIEGGDQVGKGDTSCSLISEFENEDIPVTRLSFPQYSTPLGHIIRRVLTEDNRETLQKRDIEVRGMLYALDRLQAAESILRRPEILKGVLLWDRSPFSHSLTISYGLTKVENFSQDDVRELAELGIYMEDFLISTFNLNNCVIELIKRDSYWSSLRNGGEDQYETKDVQERASEVYKIYSDIIGNGWKRVFVDKEIDKSTRSSDLPNWRERKERDTEVIDFINQRIPINNLKDDQARTVDRIDVVDISKDIYGVDTKGMEEVLDFYNALDKNDKNTIYEKGGQIADYIIQNSKGFELKNEGVINSMRKIFRAYPECLSIIEYHYGDKFRQNIQEVINE
jgi:thymidylate kinase